MQCPNSPTNVLEALADLTPNMRKVLRSNEEPRSWWITMQAMRARGLVIESRPHVKDKYELTLMGHYLKKALAELEGTHV